MNIYNYNRSYIMSMNFKKRKIDEVSVEQNDNESDENCDNDHDKKILETILKYENKVDRENNHIYFRSDVNRVSITLLSRFITDINNEYNDLNIVCKIAKLEPLPIYLHITSSGGNLLYGLMAYDCIKNSKIPIYTIIEGYAFSAGTIISLAGSKKYATNNSMMLIHQLSTVMMGTYEQLDDQHYNNKILMNKIKKIYLENTKMKQKEISDLLKKDIYLDTKKCIKLGIVDDVYNG